MQKPSTPKAPWKPIPLGIRRMLEDPRQGVRLLTIRTKGAKNADGKPIPGKLVRLVPNVEQDEVVDLWCDGRIPGIIAGKPRQIGFTTIISALFFLEWLLADEPILLVQLAHKKEVAKEILTMHKIFLKSLPAALRPEMEESNTTTLRKKNGATLRVDTARGDGGLRSLTVHRLHISEFAFCKDPDELRAASFSAVPTEEGGRMVLESTANYVGDVLHVELKKAFSGKSELGFTPLFFPWYKHATYTMPVPRGFTRTDEEEALAAKYRLTDGQLVWRRVSIGKLGRVKFRREYPLTLDDAYASVAGAWISFDQIEHVRVLAAKPIGLTVYEPYDPKEFYVIAADCGAGTGEDYSTAVVLNARTWKVAAVFRDNTISNDAHAEQLWQLSRTYGSKATSYAAILVERNFWGIPVINKLRTLGANLYREQARETEPHATQGEQRDFVTTAKTKLEILEALRSALLDGSMPEVDSICWEEIRGGRVTDDGAIEFPKTVDGHGDMVMTYAMALRAIRHAPRTPPQKSMMDRHIEEQKRQRILKANQPDALYR